MHLKHGIMKLLFCRLTKTNKGIKIISFGYRNMFRTIDADLVIEHHLENFGPYSKIDL